jgi:cation/acetate symporter
MASQQTSTPSSEAPAVVRGLSLAADAISAPFLLGLAGAVFAWGYDGLAYGLGLGAGILLLQLLIAPLMPKMGARTLPELFALRFGGWAPRAAAAVAVAVAMATLLVAQLMVGGLVTARLFGLDAGAAIAVAGAALLAVHVLGGRFARTWIRALVFLLMLLALLAPAVQLSADWYGLPVPQVAYANALAQIQGLEETLLEQDLADPAVMKPMLTPFVSLDPLNFFGLVLGLALGLACLPNVLARHVMGTSARAARWSAVWALLFAFLLLSVAPALAAYAKLAVLKLVAGHTDLARLPEWIFAYGRLGLVEVCGAAATDAAAVAKACAALPDAGAALRLQDVALSPDMIALAAPEITGLGPAMLALIAAAALAAFLVTADGPLVAIVGALGGDARRRSWLAPFAIAAIALVLAGLVASTRPASILDVAAASFTLAAAGLFVPLVMGLWWRRASAPAATVAVIAGLAVALHYLLATRYLAVGFFETWQSLSSAGPTAREVFGALKDAWATAAPGAAKDAAWAALDAHAQGIANWWGIGNLATILIALPVAIAAMILVSLAAPQQRPPETAS